MGNVLRGLLLLFCVSFFSGGAFAQNYSIKKVGELHLQSLATAAIRDYDPGREIYLGFVDKGSEGVELAIFDTEGEILVSKNRRGEGPEEYLSSALTMGFAPDGNIWVQTSMELLKYDLEFNLIHKKRFEPKVTTHIYTGPKSKFIPLTKAGNPSFVVNMSNTSNLATSTYIPSEIQLVDYYDPAANEVKSTISLGSRNGFKGIEDEEFPVNVNPVFAADPQLNNFYFTTDLDNEITVYNPVNWHVIQRIPVKHESFEPLDDIPIPESNLPTMPSMGSPGLFAKNKSLLVFGSGLVGLVYVRGETEASFEMRKSTGKTYRLNDPEYHRLILFKDGIQLPGEHIVPSGMIEMPLTGNRFLVKTSLGEEEPDYIPYEIWEIVEE